MSAEDKQQWDRYWWCVGPDGWWIETWEGEPGRDNVIRLFQVTDLASAEAAMKALNR